MGTEGDDTLIGSFFSDELLGLGGDDTLESSASADIFNGGEGNDTVDYSGISVFGTGLVISLFLGGASGGLGGDANGDTFISIENVIGSAEDDTIEGDAGSNVLTGGGGDDFLRGREGSDTLDGGLGNDIADYFSSSAAVNINLETGILSGGDAEGDTLISIESVFGTAFEDTITGNSEANLLAGREGNDTLNGGLGDDVLSGGDGADTLNGGEGDDLADYATSTSAVTVDLFTNTVSGGEATGDTLISIEGAFGSGFDDTFIAGENADEFRGGNGVDTVSYENAEGAVGITLNLGSDFLVRRGAGAASGDLLIDVEDVIGSAFDDLLTGSAIANRLTGGAGADRLNGGGGNDVILDGLGDDSANGGTGDDTFIVGAGANDFDGGEGSDTLDYSQFFGAITFDLVNQTLSGGAGGNDTISSIENAIGTNGSDTFIDSSASSTLVGGAGNDAFIAGAGINTYDGGDGVDTADYSAFFGAINVNLADNTTTGGAAGNDTLISIENITGTNGSDTLIGNDEDNILNGGRGNDTVSGGGGNDVILDGSGNDSANGGAGDDTFIVGAGANDFDGGTGSDTVDYSAFFGAINVNLADSTTTGGAAGNDTLTDVENIIGTNGSDTLIGDDEDNILNGGRGNDTVSGGAGNDTFVVGTGLNTIEGGSGSDTVDYSQFFGAITFDLVSQTLSGGGGGTFPREKALQK